MAASKLSAAEVLKLLSAESYVKLMSIDRPKTQEALLDRMVLDKLLVKEINGLYSITNLGAIFFAEKLSNFPSLARGLFASSGTRMTVAFSPKRNSSGIRVMPLTSTD